MDQLYLTTGGFKQQEKEIAHEEVANDENGFILGNYEGFKGREDLEQRLRDLRDLVEDTTWRERKRYQSTW